MRRFVSALVLTAPLLAAGCASTPDTAAAQLHGCWYFEPGSGAAGLGLPWGVELTDQPLEGWPAFQERDSRVAVTLVGPEDQRDFPFGYWEAPAPDSVRIGAPGGGGWTLNLELRDSTLVGTARSTGDAGLGARPSHSVTLIRARCPGE